MLLFKLIIMLIQQMIGLIKVCGSTCGIIVRTPKLRDSQAGRGGCFPSFRVD